MAGNIKERAMHLIHLIWQTGQSYIHVLSSLYRLEAADWFRCDVLVERGVIPEQPYSANDALFDSDNLLTA